MTRPLLQARLEELEKQLAQQERIRDAAQTQARTAKVAVHQIQGACAILRELLDKDGATQSAAPIGPDGAPEDSI
jgi:uncharacterized coiled-coil protein SlyX